VTFRIFLSAYVEQPDGFSGVETNDIEAWIRSVLEQRYQRLFAACRALDADVFGIGTETALWTASAADAEQLDMKTLYANTEAVFDIDVTLVHATDSALLG